MKEVNKNKHVILILAIILFVSLTGLGLYIHFNVLNTDLIHTGVKVDEFDVSQMTKEDALNFVRDKKRGIIEKNIKLTYQDKEYSISMMDLGFDYNYSEAIDKAYLAGREGNTFKRLKDIIDIRINGVKILLDSNADGQKIKQIVDTVAEDIDVESKDAEIHLDNGNIKVVSEVIGKKVDKEKLFNMIKENISKLNIIKIPVNSIIPRLSKDLLIRINGAIGEFSTSFKGSSQNRIENIRLSADAIKGKILMPGESMSFNETTGPREKEFGYREASVILSGEYTPGVGGGVCQTSTTLYNALLLADVTILERSPHSIPANYVDLGQDAAVAYGVLDLKFRNDFDYPIYFDSKIIGDRVYFYVYGDANNRDYTVKIESEIVEIIHPEDEIIRDSALKPGNKVLVQKGRTGYRVNAYKSILKDGKIVNRELINKDFYKPRNAIYKVGKDVPADTESDKVYNENGNIND